MEKARKAFGRLYGILVIQSNGDHYFARMNGCDSVAWWHRPEEAEEALRVAFAGFDRAFVVVLPEGVR